MTNLSTVNFASKIHFPLPLWKYLIIFQSWQQLRSWTIVVVGATLCVYFAIDFFDPESLPMELLLLGVAMGGIFSVVMVIPVEIHFKGRIDRLAYILFEKLYNTGYTQESRAANTTKFKQKTPSWLSWEETNIAIEKFDDAIIVKGGWFILLNLSRATKISYFDK